MDHELESTTLSKSFERHTAAHDTEGQPTEELLPPVHLDVNLVKNLMESYEFQAGLPGPTSNLFSQLGINLGQPGSVELHENADMFALD